MIIFVGRNLVNPPAINSNLALGPCERAQVPHLNHGIGKISVEDIGIVTIRRYNGVGCSAVKQHLIRVKEPPSVDQCLIIVVAEAVRALGV